MKRARVLVLALVLLGASAGCRQERLASGEASLVVQDGGRVVAAERGGRPRAVGLERTLHGGATVRVERGTAVVTLEGGARLELRQGSEVRLDAVPALVSGEVLVVPVEPNAASVTAAGSTVTALGPARVSRDLAVSATSYGGGLRIESAGRRLFVNALRQTAVASLGEVPSKAEPMDYDGADPWDRRYLGGAIELGDELESRSHGFTVSLQQDEGRTPGFYRLLLPALETEPGFGDNSVSDSRPPGDTLVGAAIALESQRGPFATRLAEIFAFRDEGAAWGLVALEQDVAKARSVVERVDVAIGRAPLAFASPARPVPQPASPSAPVGASSGGPAPSPAPRADAGGAPGPTSGASPQGPAGPGPSPAPPVPPVTTPVPLPVPPVNTPPALRTPVVDLLAGLLPGIVAPQGPLAQP